MNTESAKVESKFKSNMNAIELHSELNDALEQFHQMIVMSKDKCSEMLLHSVCDFCEQRQLLLNRIRNINTEIMGLSRKFKRGER